MEDRSKRTGAVRPQLDERCGKRCECDSVLNATSDENNDELNGETDDQDTEDGETGFDDGSAQVRNIRDPGQPTAKEHQEHMSTRRPYRSWCKFLVGERAAQKVGCSRRLGWSVVRINSTCPPCWSSANGDTR